ncbi:DUF3152 domain-containing protein [Sphaerisporangium corydalis]|uniref:DUF3152 domain-containing protein n=1 Tax=Sphaerisporangium corydalis TaxID=1441875 RepID=A0ABV9E5L4_9ACTN|nr:DUF3152 domain-containing protein [Sphaerisporangium corydalis]
MYSNLTPHGDGPRKPTAFLLACAAGTGILAGGSALVVDGEKAIPAHGTVLASPVTALGTSPRATGPAPGPVATVTSAPTSAPTSTDTDTDTTPGPSPVAVPPSGGPARVPLRAEPDAGASKPPPDPDGRRPPKMKVPRAGKGRYSVVPGVARPPKGGHGKVVRYLVEVEKGLPFDGREFAATVQRTLNDPRGWGANGRMRFKRVAHGPVRFRVALSSPAMTNARCLPMQTFGELSCWNGRQAVLNAKRWNLGIPGYRGDLVSYREYMINHEVGHALGHGHESCPGAGRPAPVMTQQTKSLQHCRPNAWPFAHRTARRDKPDTP